MRNDCIDYPVDEIRDSIAAGQTQQQIADRLKQTHDPRISAKLIYKVCKKWGIVCQRTGPRSGSGHPEWKGGRIEDRNGYWHVWAPEHPECLRVNEARRLKANGGYYRKEKYIQEHRLVMEKHLGRYLQPNEVVHHLNDDKKDNRIENLQLFDSNARHLAETLKGKCPKWGPSGLANMRAARFVSARPETFQKWGFRTVGHLLLSIQKELKLDVPPSMIEFDHYLASKGITAEQACEMAEAQLRSQNSEKPDPTP